MDGKTSLNMIEEKLLRSTAVAFPFAPDPWAALGQGLRIPQDEARRLVQALQDRGVVQGLWGEPNPAEPGREEVLAVQDVPPSLAAPAVLRWAGEDPEGRWWCSWSAPRREGEEPAPGAARGAARALHKLGTPLVAAQGTEALLSPGADRSYTVAERPPAPPFPPEIEAFAQRLHHPVPIPADRDFWPWLAEVAQMPADKTLRAARELVMAGRWRRFALRVSPVAAGWRGCGLAFWDFPENDLRGQAAAALAGLAATGDVAQRRPTAEAPGHLAALFMARREGEGETAAAEVARQWNRPLVRFVPLELQ